MNYTPEQIKQIKDEVLNSLEELLEKEDPSELVPTWSAILFLLDKVKEKTFFGDIVIPVRDGSCKEPYIEKQTVKMRSMYLDIISKIDDIDE